MSVKIYYHPSPPQQKRTEESYVKTIKTQSLYDSHTWWVFFFTNEHITILSKAAFSGSDHKEISWFMNSHLSIIFLSYVIYIKVTWGGGGSITVKYYVLLFFHQHDQV